MARHEVPDLRDRIEYLGLSTLMKFLRSFSRVRGRRVGMAFGRIVAGAVPLRKEVAIENLMCSFPDRSRSDVEIIHRDMCENLGLTLADFARFGRGTPETLTRFIQLENPEAVSRALEKGRGALLLTAHFGNWEVLGASLGQVGFPMIALGARQRNPLVEEMIARFRRNMGLRSLTVGKSLKPILESFDRNECLATLADQDGGEDGFFLDFLGRQASVQSGLFRLIARRGVPLITGFSMREDLGWRGEIHDPVWPRPVGTKDEAENEARRLAAIYNDRVAEYVRRYPDHWFWVHRRWRTRPPKEA
jgi:KDO2-lipid IV(A) lauroyltransferase